VGSGVKVGSSVAVAVALDVAVGTADSVAEGASAGSEGVGRGLPTNEKIRYPPTAITIQVTTARMIRIIVCPGVKFRFDIFPPDLLLPCVG